ncbi:intraflagellar transport protein 22 homolog isoform X2 [Petromyzon marinus]|uniref:Intraflagellar transport protein 22 homolog n=1 Tax=Petromyzon marinus TaxID=7757 RepID=A0AAJ7SR17_PETMA|nr:intraflagellar transport protein 22 homolog isoform X2 [Petromyzon marinus]
MFKAKILVVGPVKSGKTTMANFLGDATEAVGGEYSPTQGVRILEFESGTVDVSGRAVTCEVELWDCSGDMKFEACWPALQRDVSGVMLVFDAEQASHARELEAWHTAFVLQPRLQESQCLLVAHHKPGSDASRPLPGLGERAAPPGFYGVGGDNNDASHLQASALHVEVGGSCHDYQGWPFPSSRW